MISPVLAREYESVLKRGVEELGLSLGSPIVTFSVKDFRGSESLGIRTISPGELLSIMGERR